LSLYAVSPSPVTLTTAIQCGDHLLACAQSMPNGIGWKTLRQETPLTGFSHGAAGIACSLLKLADTSGEERFRQAACEALDYERSLFSPAKRNWLDLRRFPQTGQEQHKQTEEQVPRYGMSWSHGAPGIALARLASLCHMDDEITRQEVEMALTTIVEEGIGYPHEHVGPNHSLAHGDFGNLEALLLAAQKLDMPYLHAARERSAAQLLESMNQCGLIVGVPLNVETPGFMIGLAGIGYELLRLGKSDHIPSILVLAPPVV
jgi:lantibiotic modifying enzyme